MLAQSGSCEFHGPRVRDPKHREGNQSCDGEGSDGVEIHAEPCFDLPHLFPPLVVDYGSGNCARPEQEQNQGD